MPLPVFNSCCCGCSLQTGSLIIGYFGIVLSLILIASTASILADLDNISDNWLSYTITVLVISLIIYVIEFVFYCCLIVGAHKDNARCLRTFVIAATVMLVFAAINSIMNFTILDFASAVVNLIGLLLQAYFILIVRSFYLEIETPRQDIYYQGQTPQVGPHGYSAQPDYPAQPGYPTQQDYPAQPGNQAQLGYETQPGYPAQPGYPSQLGYTDQPGYPAQPGYQSQPALVTQPGWVAPPDYTAQPGYQNQTHGYPVHKNSEVNPEN